MQTLTRGLIAGAVGTVALNVATNLDMAIRARPASQVPAETVRRMAALVGVDLEGEKGSNRAEGLGAVLGYVAGMGTAVGFALAGRGIRSFPVEVGAVMLGAMMAGGVPPTVMGVTDPRKWGLEGWISDIVPHFLYGLTTVAVSDAMRNGSGWLRRVFG